MTQQATPDEEPGSPEEMLAALRAEQANVRRQTVPNTTAMFAAWGVAFVIGYTALYVGWQPDVGSPAGWSLAILAVAIVAGLVFTGTHLARRTAGIRGRSNRVGLMYGSAWFLSFVMAGVIYGSVASLGTPPIAMSVLTNAVGLLIVASLYMAGAAIWQDWRMFVLGVWFIVVGSIAAVITPPNGYLVQAIAGGGGFLVAALVSVLLVRRQAS